MITFPARWPGCPCRGPRACALPACGWTRRISACCSRRPDEAQAQELQRFRDLGAASIGLFLPGHAEYGYHITLAYIRTIAQGDQARRLEALLSDMEGFLLSQPPFETSAPYMAYYNDMLAFSAQRISRRERKWDP